MATLNNNQIVDVLRNAYAQSTGKKTFVNNYDIIGTGSEEEPQYPKGSNVPISSLDLQNIIDTGNDESVLGSKEQFTKGLINVLIGRWYTDASYRSSYKDVFFKNEQEFGGIVSMVSVEVPDVRENSAWKNLSNGTVVGTYEVNLPIVEEQFYGKSTSWSLPITITGEQLDSAFKDANALSEFVNYIFLVIDNKITQHIEDLDNMNRNNFIAEKLNNATTGVQKINLVDVYCTETSKDSMTVEEYLTDGDALRHGMSIMNEYSKYLRKQSTLFNTAQKTRFIPQDRFVFQLLNKFKLACEREVLTDSFHTQYAELQDRFDVVPYWQRMTDGSNDLTFDVVSSIDVKSASDGTESSYSGIVGFMCDQWAIIHTMIKQRIAHQRFDIDDLDLYEYQFVDRRMNNLTMNALVFTLEDVE